MQYTNGENNDRYHIRNQNNEVWFKRQNYTNSETETEVISNHSEQTFTVVKGKECGPENSHFVQFVQLNLIIELPKNRNGSREGLRPIM